MFTGFIASTPTFNFQVLGFSFLDFYCELVSYRFELVTRGFELVNCVFKLAICSLNL